ncbi:hypothetical protein KC957_03105 [Candidatus Saccharibacteria bacterium]|nr:hypothetical protein [Candidatus Saccharibacteria bacterium]
MSAIPEVDPGLFMPDRSLEFGAVVMACVTEFVDARETVTSYLGAYAPEALEANRKMLEEHSPEAKEMLDDLTKMMGMEMTSMLVSRIGGDPDAPTDQQFTKAYEARSRSVDMLCAYVSGYQEHMYQGLLIAYGDENEAREGAWSAAWSKLRDMVRPLEGTLLAEVADMFDELVMLRFPGSYDHTDVHRGLEAGTWIESRTFYDVMEPHLTRSIVRRRDDWSGQG